MDSILVMQVGLRRQFPPADHLLNFFVPIPGLALFGERPTAHQFLVVSERWNKLVLRRLEWVVYSPVVCLAEAIVPYFP